VPAALQTAYTQAALEYCQHVSDGTVVACRWVKLACERHLKDLERYRAPDALYYFDEEQANRVCNIIEHFPHVRGEWAKASKRIELEAWQCFIIASVFGWKYRETDMRRFRVAYIEVPRKNAKSTMSAGIGLYLTACDGEQGAHVVSAATAMKQAREVFDAAQQMARKERSFRSRFGVEIFAHAITQQETASKFEPISAEYSNLDGLNIHGAIIDELHAHTSRGIWDILQTATGSRAQPLLWAITTAGVNKAGVCYDQRNYAIQILEGRVEDDSYFGIIYTLDEGDDPFDEANWYKANPNLGISKYPLAMRTEAAQAQVMTSAQTIFFTKHLNIWVNADVQWLPSGAWERLADPTLDINLLENQPCYVGIDLAIRSDIAAVVALFPPYEEREKWAVFGRYFLPQETVQRGLHYQGWERQGHLMIAGEAMTDCDFIIEELMRWWERFQVQVIASDPYKNVPVVMSLKKRGVIVPILDIRQSTAIMSPAMKELEGMVLDHKIVHDGDPVLAWMISNVKASYNEKDELYPKKESPDRKIDGVLALLMALDQAMRHYTAATDWSKRPGLWTI
jgi:phage terminase large subunit-like protein